MSQEEDQQFTSGVGTLQESFKIKELNSGTSLAEARIELSNNPLGRFGKLVVWEPQDVFPDEPGWLARLEEGMLVGFHGRAKKNSWTGKTGRTHWSWNITCYALGPLWIFPKTR